MTDRRTALAGILAGLLPSHAFAQAGFPQQPITLVVPWAAGGAADFLARVVGERLSVRLGQQVLVSNKPGGGTNIGTQYVASAKPDGYTLLMASSNNCVNATLLPPAKVDFVRDFRPVTNVGFAPNILVVHPSVPARNVQELVALAKAKPGSLTYGSSGSGSAAHLGAEKFKLATGTDIVGVPYKGAAPAVSDLLGGHLSMMFTVIPATLPHVEAGRLRLLAVATPQRLPIFPQAPTLVEAGVRDFESGLWYGLVAPAGIPEPVLTLLHREVAAILKEESVAQRVVAQGVLPIGDTPAAFAQTIRSDIARYGELIQVAKIKPD
ncbi:tripartite tricarboxylate transporter substrate binding protein [Piscinibacter sakaiensis]|uniref:Putative exported protein n=1 Tax=Piscinibacter sakaiensis TaxID=1547922 RepID=A0A0K8NTF8_PISS1|nr:tripartite tricarboxylate transporter substrate binding protein [Piscinibacter sakaiensis]GAP33657.1 putative exported protein [Piscinibacter sakaiensis]